MTEIELLRTQLADARQRLINAGGVIIRTREVIRAQAAEIEKLRGQDAESYWRRVELAERDPE